MNFLLNKFTYAAMMATCVAALNAIIKFEPLGMDSFLVITIIFFIWGCLVSLFTRKKNAKQEV